MSGRSSQSRSASALEAATNTAVGFLLSLMLQQALFPALGHDLTLRDNLLVATAFTTLSLLRGYGVRRLFNALREDLG
ncbi:hypothetical protein LHP98_05680 [Rhodobacter sp. Har01]|uniref:DUF7220 family protein n=1 Tax=Rhodobacter sp. Har01 TaxID=2883999 RepID=UPI001D08AAEF|nr:hypothetical protein [Rhodobacter sp. Har01]MCB6177618.1 hypothetical protein [Rhodobacter sp. Har01]